MGKDISQDTNTRMETLYVTFNINNFTDSPLNITSFICCRIAAISSLLSYIWFYRKHKCRKSCHGC